LANNTQVKHRSNKQQSNSNTKRNHQTGKNKNKSYIRTNPKPQELEENKLKRVDEKKGGTQKSVSQNKTANKSSNQANVEKVKPNQSNVEKVKRNQNNDEKVKRNQSNGEKGKSNQSNGEKGKSSSNQTKNGNGNKRASGNNSSNQTSESGSKTAGDNEVKHKEQSGKFETAFNRIHKALKEMVKGTDSDAFVELLYSGYKNHSLVRKYKGELHQFAKLRNAIVHERVNADYYIAEPHIEVVERIEEIAREFEKPQTALSIATSPVFYYYEDAYLKDVLKVINKFDFTRFPVYDKDDKYIALLTSTEIIQWMAKHFSDDVVHFEDVRVKELLTNGKNYFVTFVDEDASLYHIEELFERYHTRGKKLQAVIITETGDRHGKPIGVITPWDLLDSDPED
jgi:CBS domain-containing protein